MKLPKERNDHQNDSYDFNDSHSILNPTFLTLVHFCKCDEGAHKMDKHLLGKQPVSVKDVQTFELIHRYRQHEEDTDEKGYA